eukprot:4937107-Pyramimonas_sp.AAC.1
MAADGGPAQSHPACHTTLQSAALTTLGPNSGCSALAHLPMALLLLRRPCNRKLPSQKAAGPEQGREASPMTGAAARGRRVK